MSDTIDRQAAIEIVDRYDKSHMILKGKPMLGAASIVIELEALPSAQPEQPIRCKNCKHFHEEPADPLWGRCDSTAWYDGDGNDQYVKPTDYCSYAERKEGADG